MIEIWLEVGNCSHTKEDNGTDKTSLIEGLSRYPWSYIKATKKCGKLTKTEKQFGRDER